MIDLSLLQLLKYRGEFFRIKGRIPEKALDEDTIKILNTYEKYFNTCPDAKVIDPQKLLTIFRAGNPDLPEEHKAAYENIFKNISTDISEEDKPGVMLSLLELRLGTDIANLGDRFARGEVANIHAEIRKIEQEFATDAEIKTLDFIRPDMSALLAESEESGGYHFRLECLRRTMRGLRGGDFGILAARPDKGKTTFLADQLTFMAPQVPQDRPILWLNNEGPGDRIYLRLVQAALGKTLTEIRALDDAKRDYAQALGGDDPYKIRIVNIHGRDTYTVENLIQQHKPAIIVYDMIDKIRGFKDQPRTDLALEEMYSWARDLSVNNDAVGLATSQISNEGDNMSFPPMGALKDSKTGKQGACDFQLMIGSLNDPAYASSRYISLPKNKLRREGADQCPRATVNFRPQIARFEDLPIETQ